ncbi:NAD-dependent epimerase/dehydratase family protein [Alcaligenes sp. CHO6]|uniref:NAD-dependent epimerase/dehydratase family protein n=1 Tax=Alcaligenes TaxID=507 RepID=UPI000269E5BF|nr:hypothetical protein QWA_12027 [Alcaligenes faecalis subsp. faecalis NCIB 8687]HRK86640.1 NAD-dependent epimerase/dehydratase family protein [Alcaligenes faecalis]
MDSQNCTLLLAGAGDLGTRTGMLARRHEWPVIGLRRHPPLDDHSGIEWVQADLSEPASLRLKHRPITHVLYAVSPDQRNQAAYERVFLQGLENLLNELDLKALKRFVFVSSTAVYGPSTDWVDENSPTEPTQFNGKILLEAEQRLHHRIPAQAVVIRPSGLYGPGRTQLLDRLREGRATVPDDPEHWANRLHIEDAAAACWHLLRAPAPFPCYIGTDSRPYRITELYDGLADLLGVPHPERRPSAEGGKRLRNQRLLDSGFKLEWPDAMQGYGQLIKEGA